MARDSARNSAGKVDSDRIGKMHAKRRELSVRRELARRLRGFRGKSGRVRAQSAGGRRLQRVIVKTHVARHKPGKAKGSLTRHASYLGRDSASADGKPGVFYNAARTGPGCQAADGSVGAGPAPLPDHHLARARRRHPGHDGICARRDAARGEGSGGRRRH